MTEQASVANAALPPESGSGLAFSGLYEVFLAPGKFFEKLRGNPKILVPYLVYAAVMSAFLFLTADIIVRMQIEAAQANPNFSPDQMPPASVLKLLIIGFGGIVMMLPPLIAAGLASLFGNFVMAARASFKQLLSVMLYGEIVFALGALVVLPMVLARDSLQVSFSLALLVPDAPLDSLTYVGLSKISLFYIWEIIVIGIGLAKTFEMPSNKGYLLAVLSMGMISILHVLFVAITSSFTS